MPATAVVFPLPATFTADGTANVNQTRQEQLSAPAADYTIAISDVEANDVFKAFSVAEATSDSSADIVVSYVSGNATIVKAALKYALENGTQSSSSLKSLMESYMTSQVATDLSSLGLYNILEAEAVSGVSISNATIGTHGSEAMATVLAGQVASKNNANLNIVAAQLPYASYSGIPTGGNLDSAFAVGDSLSFHFTFNSTLAVTPVNQSIASVTGSASAAAAAQAAFNSNQHSRTLNLVITKAADEAAIA